MMVKVSLQITYLSTVNTVFCQRWWI